MVANVQDGYIDEWIWRQTLQKMYDEGDQAQLVQRFQVLIEASRINSGRGLRGYNSARGAKLAYKDFQKTILDFQLQEHERFLDEFTNQFKAVDRNQVGVIDNFQFKKLLFNMDTVCSESVAQTDTSHLEGTGRA